MKKLISMTIALVIVLALCACSSEPISIEQVKQDVVGMWYSQDGDSLTGYIFSDDGSSMIKVSQVGTQEFPNVYGTYSVQSDGIHLNSKSEGKATLTYKYSGSKLVLYDGDLKLKYLPE